MKQESFLSCKGQRQEILYLETVELALENSQQFPRLSEALYCRARRLLPSPEPWLLEKYFVNPKAYNQLLSKLGLTDYYCTNCKRLKCLNKKAVTIG